MSSDYAPCMRASHATFKVRGAAVYIVILIVILIVVILINHCCHRGHPYHRHHSSHPHPHHGYRQLVGPSVVHIPQVHMEIDDSDFKVNWDFIHHDPVLALGQTLGCPCIPKQIGLLARSCQSNLSKNAHLFDSCAELCHKNIAAAGTAYSNPPR